MQQSDGQRRCSCRGDKMAYSVCRSRIWLSQTCMGRCGRGLGSRVRLVPFRVCSRMRRDRFVASDCSFSRHLHHLLPYCLLHMRSRTPFLIYFCRFLPFCNRIGFIKVILRMITRHKRKQPLLICRRGCFILFGNAVCSALTDSSVSSEGRRVRPGW